MRRRPLDIELVRRSLMPDLVTAQAAVEAGEVLVRGAIALRCATLVAPADALALRRARGPWASRAGLKLAGALDCFALGVEGRDCLDAGAATGGFTDVLLARGARSVAAVDIGFGQLRGRLRVDPRVRVLERTDIRTLSVDQLGARPDLVVVDVSRIPTASLIAALRALAQSAADFVVLVKPQFELEAARVGVEGIVRDPHLRAEAVRRVASAAATAGLGVAGVGPSALPGAGGNHELVCHLREGAPPLAEAALAEAVGASPAPRAVTEGLS